MSSAPFNPFDHPRGNSANAGQFAVKQRDEPGELNLDCGVWPDDLPQTGDAAVARYNDPVPDSVAAEIAQVAPSLDAAERDELGRQVAFAQLMTDWNSNEPAEAAWQCEAYDTAHPGQAPLLRIEPGEYAGDGEGGVDWEQLGVDNADAWLGRRQNLLANAALAERGTITREQYRKLVA